MDEMSNGQFVLRRLLPFVVGTLVLSVMFGLGRATVLFVPGIFGMMAGGVLGYATGRVGRGDPLRLWLFPTRAGVTLGATLLYTVVSVAVVAIINSMPLGLPIEWIGDVLAGRDSELFVGYSVNSYQSTGGPLTGAWWVVFMAVDALLFAFLFLIMTGVGYSPDDGEEEFDEEEYADHEAPVENLAPPPLPFDSKPPRLGTLSFAAFALCATAVVVVVAAWPQVAVLAGAEPTPRVTAGQLQGEWIFGPEAVFLGRSDEARSFTGSMGLGREFAGFSKVESQFMISMEPRRDGVYEGRIYVRQRDILTARMRPSADLSELVFLVDWPTRNGMEQVEIRASRTD